MPRRRTPPVDPPESFTVNKRVVWIVSLLLGSIVGVGSAVWQVAMKLSDIDHRISRMEETMSQLTRADLEILAASWAESSGIDRALLFAMIEQESGWEPWAWNPEPRYRYFWNVATRAPFRTVTEIEIGSEKPPADFPTLRGDRDQEWWGQQVSWGLLQVMGAVGRERGFLGPYLPALCDPAINLFYGTRHFAALLKRHGQVQTALLRWNGGGNPAYPGEVIERSKKYEV